MWLYMCTCICACSRVSMCVSAPPINQHSYYYFTFGKLQRSEIYLRIIDCALYAKPCWVHCHGNIILLETVKVSQRFKKPWAIRRKMYKPHWARFTVTCVVCALSPFIRVTHMYNACDVSHNYVRSVNKTCHSTTSCLSVHCADMTNMWSKSETMFLT